MSLPDGVTTCLLTYGPITDTFGNTADSITVEVVADRTIVHAASGRTLFKSPVAVVAVSGGVAQLPVPHTNQSGFRDQQQNALTGWYYTVRLTARFAGGSIETDTKTFQPLVGQTTVDADLLPSDGMVTPGVTTTTAVVTSIAGQTGEVTAEQVATALTADLSDAFVALWKPFQTYADDTRLVGPDGRLVVAQYGGGSSTDDYYDDVDQGYLYLTSTTPDDVSDAVSGGVSTAITAGGYLSDAARVTKSALAAGKSAHASALGTARQVVPVTISAINPQSSSVSLLETSLGTLTYTNSTTTFTTPGAVAHGLAVGDKVRFLNGSKTGMNFLNGSTYYVRSVPTTSTFLVAATLGGGSSPDFGGDGTVPGLKTGYLNYSPWKKATQTATITAATDTFTVPLPHFLAVGDPITVGSSTAGGVTSDTTYYVKTVPTTTSFTVSAAVRGTTLDVTSDGTGALGQVNPVYAVTGWRPTQKSAFSPADIYTQPDPNVTTPTPGTVTTGSVTYPLIIDNADRFEVAFFNDSSHEAYVLVDGVVVEMVTTAQLTAAGNGSGQTGTKLYTLPDTGRHVISVRHQGAFAGINVPSTAKVSRYINPNRGAFWILVGDSFTEGTGSAGVYFSLGAWAQRMLNIENLWQAGSGGSGYSASGVRAALFSRYQNDIINQGPDEIVIAMGLNDPRSNLTQINDTVSKATTVWDAIIAQLPNANLRIVGPFSPKGRNATTGTDYRDASLVALDLALQAAAVARGLRFISPIQEGWITGNGRVGATTGNGNSDIYITTDGTHPSPAGHEYFGWRLAGHLAVSA